MTDRDPQPNDLYSTRLSTFGVHDDHEGDIFRPIGIVDRYDTHAVMIGRTTQKPRKSYDYLESPKDVGNGMDKDGYWLKRFAHPVALGHFGLSGCQSIGVLTHPQSSDLQRYWNTGNHKFLMSIPPDPQLQAKGSN